MEGLKRDTNRKKFSMGNIFGDPFALATISIAIVRHNWQELWMYWLTHTDGMDYFFRLLHHCSVARLLPKLFMVVISVHVCRHHRRIYHSRC